MAEGDGEEGGFREFVKNPEYRRFLERQQQRQPPSPDGLDQPAIRKLIFDLLDHKPDWDTHCLIRQLGEPGKPALLEALRDPRFADAPGYSESILDGSPFEELCDGLQPLAPPEAVEPLAALVHHPSSRVRQLAAYTLGHIATDDCVEPIATALNEPDEHVRTYAAMGIHFGVKEGRATSSYARGIFAAMVNVLDVDCYGVMDQIPRGLMRIDPARASEVLQDPARFHAGNRFLYRLLEALNQYDAPIPADKLFALLHDLSPQTHEFFVADSYCSVLKALARQKVPGAEEVIRDALASDEENIRTAAAEALCVLIDVSDPLGVVLNRLNATGFKGLSRPQKVYYVIHTLDMEVRNGGFAQYFVNSSGNHAHLAVKALRMIGAPLTAGIVQRALNLFGPDGPQRSRSRRHDQLADLTPEQDAEMSRLDTDFYTDPDGLKVKLADYVRENKEAFIEGLS